MIAKFKKTIVEKFKDKNDVLSWAAFFVCILIGTGIGMFFHQTAIGFFIGLGIGYSADPFVESIRKKYFAK